MGKSLLINVDDIGIYPEAVRAAIEAIEYGAAALGSVMVVCSGSEMALAALGERPEIPIGVHLTLTRDFRDWAWAPLTRGKSIQHNGSLAPIDLRDELLSHARTKEVADEFRAQLEKALAAGLQVTHLDWHCLADGGREDIFDATLSLAREHQIELRAWTDYGRRQLTSHGHIAQDQPFIDSFSLPTEGKLERLVELIKRLPAGFSEWAVHPARYNPDDAGSSVRLADYDALTAPELLQALDDNGVTVLGYGTYPRA